MKLSVERAASIPIAAMLLFTTVGVLWVVLHLGVRATELAQTQTAADAAALAGAVGGADQANQLARRNGASVTAFDRVGGGVVVRVEINDIERVAAAEAPPTLSRAGLAPAMAAAVATTEAAIGSTIPIVSGYRSPAEQQWLWDHRHDNPFPVAAPGTSNHEVGLAIDVAQWFAPILAGRGPITGLCRPLPGIDPVHFELCRRMPSR